MYSSKSKLEKLSLKKELIQSAIIFLIGAVVNILVWCGNCFESYELFFLNAFSNGIFWVLLWKGSHYIVWYLDSIFPWVQAPFKRFLITVVSVVVYTTVVVYGLDLFLDLVFFDKSFSQAIAYQNIASLDYAIVITLGINTIMHGRGFLYSWRQASIDIEKLKTEQAFTQFQSLKNQVNPHFLFNSLNALSSLIYDDQEKAVEFVRKLSSVYRYVLEKKDQEVVPVEDEIKFLENFVFLQKIRFGENLKFHLDIDREGGYLPPLALQLLVENAIKHNVVSDTYPLSIDVSLTNGHCRVRNNIKEKLHKDSTGIGLANLQARYKYLSDKEVVLENDGKFFEVSLPILDFVKAHELSLN
ncbi:MAG: histidine kinase [Bacteroidota bacterium]